MKITKTQLKKIIAEATVDKDQIEDTVMDVLSDEGGAAGLEPIEDELEKLEDEETSLPDDDIEDIINRVAGVKRHADGDFVDTTKLESRMLKVSQACLRRIIREELEMDYNLQAAVDDAKEAGASEDEVQSVLASSGNTDELIVMLRSMSRDYPTPESEE